MSSILEQFELASAAASAKKLQSQRHADLGPAFQQDLTSFQGPSIAFGIVLAGGAYPLVLAAIGFVVICGMFLSALVTDPTTPALMQLAVIPLFLAAYAGCGTVLGSIWAGLVSLVTLPIVYLFVRSLQLKGSIIWLGAIAGGLVGFVAVLPVTLSLPWVTPTVDGWQVALMLLLGPGLTTIIGQLGGAWGGRRTLQFASAAEWNAVLAEADTWQSNPEPASDSAHDSDAEEPRLQFRITHMMWIFVWLSLLLSVIRLSGIPFQFVLPLLLGWLVYQTITLYGGWLYIRWRAARSAATTQPFHVEPLAN